VMRVLNSLQKTLSILRLWKLTGDEAMAIINDVKEKSGDLVALVEDCLMDFIEKFLRGYRTQDSFGLGYLKSRITMRLTFLED
jgi:hypothetical protein